MTLIELLTQSEYISIALDFLSYGMRWLHIIAVIAWMGFAFHVAELDRKAKAYPSMPAGAVAEVWSTHAFGVYRTVKYLVPPKKSVSHLVLYHWQIKTVLLTGLMMMVLVYYRNAELYLIDATVQPLSAWAAITLSATGLMISSVIYHALHHIPLANHKRMMVLAGFVFIVILAYFYNQVFSSRGTMIQMAAMMATWVSTSIIFVMIPTVREMAKSAHDKDPLFDKKIEKGSQYRRHNDYMMLAIIFLMGSMHIPLLQINQKYTWLVIAAVVVIGAVARHFFNVKHETGRKLCWPWVLVVLLTLFIISLNMLDRNI